MGRRKIIRTPEEEEEHKRSQRSKRAKYIQNLRQKKNLNNNSDNDSTMSYQNFSDIQNSSSENLDTVINDINYSRSSQSFSNNSNRLINNSTNNSLSTNNIFTNNGTITSERVHSYQQEDVSLEVPDVQNSDSISEHYIGKLDILCTHCNARHFAAEKVSNKGTSFNDCCSHGKVVLDPLPKFPNDLRSLFDYSHPQSKHFHDRVRAYNSSFSFASFNANLINFHNRRSGPYCFKIQGQVYYQINTSLYPEVDDIPRFGQLFIVD